MRHVGGAGQWTTGGSPTFSRAFPELVPFAFNVGWRFFRGNRQAAEDVAQETMTRAFVKWARVAEHPKPEAWITCTALNVSLEMSRRNRRSAPLPAMAPLETADAGARVVAADELRRALSRLSERQRLVLVWRYYFDASVAETAAALGLTESKVKDATHEATTKLAKIMRTETSDR